MRTSRLNQEPRGFLHGCDARNPPRKCARSMAWVVLRTSLACVGCTGPGDDTGDPTPTQDVAHGPPAVVFMTQDANEPLYRLSDLNNDGDYNDDGEMKRFKAEVGAARIALDDRTVLVVRKGPAAPGPQIYRLQDINLDDDADDAGEDLPWFSGVLPVAADTFEVVVRAADRVVIAARTIGAPTSIYSLRDENHDGDADVVGEVTTLAQIPNALGAPSSIAVDTRGQLWMLTSGQQVYIVRSGVAEIALSSAVLQAAGLRIESNKLAAMPDGTVLLAAATFGLGGISQELVAMRDVNNDGTLTADELTVRWSTTAGEFVSTSETLQVLDDGSNMSSTGGLLLRMTDADGSGDSLQRGETYVAHDFEFGFANGQPISPTKGISTAVAVLAQPGPNPPAHPDGCAWLAGRWTFGNSCDEFLTSCWLYQDGCAFHTDCGFVEGTGTMDGTALTFGSQCDAHASGTTIAGSCTTTPCRFTLSHE